MTLLVDFSLALLVVLTVVPLVDSDATPTLIQSGQSKRRGALLLLPASS